MHTHVPHATWRLRLEEIRDHAISMRRRHRRQRRVACRVARPQQQLEVHEVIGNNARLPVWRWERIPRLGAADGGHESRRKRVRRLH